EVRRSLAQPQLDVPQFVAGRFQLRRDVLERRDRALGEAGEAARTLTVVRRERGRGGLCGCGEGGDVAHPLALSARALLVGGLHARGVLDERAELGEPRVGERGVRGQLLVAAARGLEIAPRRARRRTARELLLAAEAIEHLELVRRPRETPLLEL